MDARPRRLASTVTESAIPARAGAYAFYRDGDRAYVGKAGELRGRIWKCHLRKGAAMTNSALRRNVAAELGIATAADIKAGRYRPTAADAARVTAAVAELELAWIECASAADAEALESRLKAEYMPPLTKR